MNPPHLLILSCGVAFLAACAPSSPDALSSGPTPSLGFSGPRMEVDGVFYETSYAPECRNDRNEEVTPHGGVGVICEEPRRTSYSLSGPGEPGIFRGDRLELTLKSEDGTRVLAREILRSGDVILIPSDSRKPVFVSRNWTPPAGSGAPVIQDEFRKLIAGHRGAAE